MMYVCFLYHAVYTQEWAVWIVAALFFLLGLSTVGGVIISPCGNDQVTEVVAGEETVITCTAKGRIEWRLQLHGSDGSQLLATCENTCQTTTNYSGLLVAGIKKPGNSSSMTLRAMNRSKSVKFFNRKLLCVLVNEKSQHVASAGCSLNYMYPPEGVSCTAVNESWSVTLSCVISSAYSSRGHYSCQLYREKRGSNREALELVSMMTSSTSERISEDEVKVSGVCQFNTTLPAQEGHYRFDVSVSPGGRTYPANNTADYKWITSNSPVPPNVSCGPQPFVLENTNITCTCGTASLGQPAGFLVWVTGNRTNLELKKSTRDLPYTQSVTLSDHANTWIRCDVIWGNETIPGGKYTANVGYAAKPQRFLANGHEGTLTVSEGDLVYSVCEADGRPAPDVSLYNNDNNTVIRKALSVTNFTFTSRCEDTATYTCSAWNEFSGQSDLKTSLSVTLLITCKPRRLSSTHLPKFTSLNQTARLDFDVIAYPVPHEFHLWENMTDETYKETEISSPITCKTDKTRRYLSRCTLTVFNISFQSKTGVYLVQVINEIGDENFTVEIVVEVDPKSAVGYSVIIGSVVCVVIVAVFVLVAVIVKIKKVPDRKRDLDQPEAIPVPSQPEPCQVPLYAVVDKTKKINFRPAQAFHAEERTHRARTEGATGLEPGCAQETEAVYAVVDKARNKCSGVYIRSLSYWQVCLREDESFYMNYDSSAVYQNDVQAVRPPMSQNEAADKSRNISASPPSCCALDDGRWENQNGLTYTLAIFDVTEDVEPRLRFRDEKTNYCALRELEKNLPSLDKT